MTARRVSALALAALLFSFLLTSCSLFEQGRELLTEGNIKKAGQVAGVVRKTFADITEEEEYYIGRSVAALILSRYKVYNDPALNAYVNLLGNAVAAYSDRPEIYGGWRFLVLNTSEINALAAPGGFVFITRGLIRQCRDEEMLAAVLAHEIGHVAAKHGLKSIKKARLVEAFKMLGQEAAKKYTPQELSRLTIVFEDVLGDIAGSLIERGYDRKYEYEADTLSVKYALATGYHPGGLSDFLKSLAAQEGQTQAAGWFKTHPAAKDRLARVENRIKRIRDLPVRDSIRLNRFKRNYKG
ncbi:MAG: M48 family metalloprotease [Candidatus Aminicenantes bacterium]|nr:M48 family metalloprotease [Candidatus Aminicenantes bacterium]